MGYRLDDLIPWVLATLWAIITGLIVSYLAAYALSAVVALGA